MRLSVIVTSYNSPAILAECLASLARQSEAAEIVVADCSPQDPAGNLQARFPKVRFLHCSGRRRVPELRWAALAHTTGGVVAAVEARCVPSPQWCRELLRAHEERPEAPAVGGPVLLAAGAGAMSTGLYFNEYGLFAPPLEAGWRSDLSGANLSYKRAALEAEADLLRAGAWETLLHARWRERGLRLWLADTATVTFHNSMPLATILRQRFHYGRGYAGTRFTALAPRFAYALGSPLVLPFLLTARTACLRWDWIRSLPWQFLFALAWSIGETAGYLFGPPQHHDIF